MTSTTAAAGLTVRLSCVDGMMQCPICLRDFSNPRSLPCLHTFCLRCIETQWLDRSPGDRMPCPVCRAVLPIPPGGLKALPHNFYIQQLIDAKKVAVAEVTAAASAEAKALIANTGQTPPLCDACGQPGRGEAAMFHCVDCHQKLCTSCGQRKRSHGAAGGSHHHRLKPLRGAKSETGNESQPADQCDKHDNRLLELYCFDCKMNVCLLCFVVEHRQHECHDIKQVAESMSYRMEADEQKILFRIIDVHNREQQVGVELSRLVGELDAVERSIRQRGNDIKMLIDRHVSDLLGQVQTIRADTRETSDNYLEKLVSSSSAMEEFYQESREMKKLKPCDLTKTAGRLHRRSKMLLLTNCVSVDDFRLPHVSFVPENLKISDESNSVGQVHVDSSSPESATNLILSEIKPEEVCLNPIRQHNSTVVAEFSQNITDRSNLTGVTQLDGNIFIVYAETNLIDVFSSNSPRGRLATIHVDGLASPTDVVACPSTRQLFVADNSVESCCIWKMSSTSTVRNWSTDVHCTMAAECIPIERRPWSLSITSGRLLITPYVGNRLYVHSATDGRLVDQITLSYYMEPQHAVETPRGTFVVCHGSRMDARRGQISEVDRHGRFVRRFNRQSAGDIQPPVRVALSDARGVGSLLVLDSANRRILSLDGDLRLERIFDVANVDGGLAETEIGSRMCFSFRCGWFVVGRTSGFDLRTFERQRSIELRGDNSSNRTQQVIGDLTICCSGQSVACDSIG